MSPLLVSIFLKKKFVKKLKQNQGLWGRSMGAATAIMYGASDPSIAGMILDSPFTSLKQLSKELVNSTNV